MSNETKALLIDGDTVNKTLESIGVAAANAANTNRTLAECIIANEKEIPYELWFRKKTKMKKFGGK